MVLSLSGQTAVVTGSAAGIGAATAALFKECGATVIGLDSATGVDVRDSAAIAKSFSDLQRVDILINNAGIYPRRSFMSMAESEWDEVMDVNLKGVFRCTRAVVPRMIEQRYGRIVNVSSVNFFRGGPLFTHYTASKAGVVGFTRSLARELGPFGIHVNCITPGAVETEAEKRVAEPGEIEALVAQQCIPRRIQPLDVARVCLFLCSPLSDGLTGQIVNVDGGRILH